MFFNLYKHPPPLPPLPQTADLRICPKTAVHSPATTRPIYPGFYTAIKGEIHAALKLGLKLGCVLVGISWAA